MTTRSPSRMIGFLIGCCFCAVSQCQADDRVAQALDLVNQLLERPGSDETTEPASGENPFSTTDSLGTTSDLPASQSQPPEVRLDAERIEVEVSGRTIVVDRPSTNLPDTTGLNPAAGRRGLRHTVNEALATAGMFEAYALAVSDFQQGRFDSAADRLHEYQEQLGGNGLVAQTYALILFQQGNWQQSAEWVYNGLSDSHPFEWHTVSGIYGDPTSYSPKYRELQTVCRQHPDRADLHFLLAYHHLMLGHRQHAVAELEIVEQTLASDPVIGKLAASARTQPASPPQPLAD